MMGKIIFVYDIFRDNEVLEAKRCIYMTVYALFKRAFDLEVTAPQFSLGMTNIFEDLRNKYADVTWPEVYFELPEVIEKEYAKLLDRDAIYVSYEAPEWLFRVWRKYNIKYIDLRLSYLRFLPDIPVMISSNIPSLVKSIGKFEIADSDILFEANLLKASYKFRHFTDWKNCGQYKDSLIIIGQTSSDTSLMVQGHSDVIKLQDYHSEICEILSRYKSIFYKPHPFSLAEHRESERSYIQKITGKEIPLCTENFYNLVAQDFRVDFLALSSGAVKEAEYFGKKNYMLMSFPFAKQTTNDSVKYVNVESYYFFSPKFWQECLADELSIVEKCQHYRDPHTNIMRNHHNASWSFNQFYYENRSSVVESICANGQPISSFVLGNHIFRDSLDRIKDSLNVKYYKFTYRRYKVLSKITFGKTRKRYKKKRAEMKQRLRDIRQFLKGN
jgi:hypothetical protein